MERSGEAASEVVRDDGGGRPGGATRPGGTTGERPGGTAGRPGGATGISLGAGGGDFGDTASATAEPESDSTATDDVGDRGAGGGGGCAASLPFVVFAVAGVVGRFGNDEGVEGREDDAAEVLAALFLRISARADMTGVVVDPDRCGRAVVPARRACRVL